MLLFTRPGDRLVLGGGERGCGGAATQPPERDSHARPTAKKRTPHHHHPPGITVALIIFRAVRGTFDPPTPAHAGRFEPGAVRPAPSGFVSRLAGGGSGLADGQPLLGRENHRGGGHIGLLPAALLLPAGRPPRQGVEAGFLT